MHNDDKVDDATGKPDIILFYNSTKGGVDTVDQFAQSYSVQHKTKRWPLAYFMNVLNLSAINAYIAVYAMSKLEKRCIICAEAVSSRACA